MVRVASVAATVTVCRSKTRSCWSGSVSVFVDEAAAHSGA
jgi:hypothetical protein